MAVEHHDVVAVHVPVMVMLVVYRAEATQAKTMLMVVVALLSRMNRDEADFAVAVMKLAMRDDDDDPYFWAKAVASYYYHQTAGTLSSWPPSLAALSAVLVNPAPLAANPMMTGSTFSMFL